MKNDFYIALSEALKRADAEQKQIAWLVGMSWYEIGDLAAYDNEWYAVTPFGRTRLICRLIGVDYHTIFRVTGSTAAMCEEFSDRLKNFSNRLKEELDMSALFWDFAIIDHRALDLHPFKLIEETATVIDMEIGRVIAVLDAQ